MGSESKQQQNRQQLAKVESEKSMKLNENIEILGVSAPDMDTLIVQVNGPAITLKRRQHGWSVRLSITAGETCWHDDDADDSDKKMWNDLQQRAFDQRDNEMDKNREVVNRVCKNVFKF